MGDRRADAASEGQGRMSRSNHDFMLGVLWAAWVLHSAHGQDSIASELLRGTASVDTFRRLARQEDYPFRRCFWADVRRDSARQKGRRVA